MNAHRIRWHPGERVVVDVDGVVIVPLDIAPEFACELKEMEAFKIYVFEQALKGESIVAL